MNYNLTATLDFQRDLKFLARKYPSIKSDIQMVFDSLRTNPTQGAAIGNNSYKVRFAIRSKGKGKSGGGRIITYFFVKNSEVILLALYDKSEHATITDEEVKARLERYTRSL